MMQVADPKAKLYPLRGLTVNYSNLFMKTFQDNRTVSFLTEY